LNDFFISFNSLYSPCIKFVEPKPEGIPIQKVKDFIAVIKSALISVFQCMFLSLFLDAIFEKQVEIARYPKSREIGPKMYTKDTLLVRRFPELQRIARNTIEKLHNIYQAIINVVKEN